MSEREHQRWQHEADAMHPPVKPLPSSARPGLGKLIVENEILRQRLVWSCVSAILGWALAIVLFVLLMVATK
jgi:hypothetical protein